jgi:outer membrane lipase/esterase
MDKRLCAAAAAGIMLFAAGAALADDDDNDAPVFTSVTVFGDSLSDAGNLGLATGVGPNSFTTNPGDVAVQVIASHYGFNLGPSLAGGTDYAWGGSGILRNVPSAPLGLPTLTDQVTARIAAGPLDPNGLYAFWGGANDIFYYSDQVGRGMVSPGDAIAAMGPTAAQAGVLIGRLQSAGADTIIVFNLPNIARTPDAQAAGPSATLLLLGLTNAYNTALNQAMAGKTGIVPVNINAFFAEVLDNPGFYGFTNVTQRACTTASSLTCTHDTLVTPNAYQTWLYADGVHPTEAAHRLTGDLVISELIAPQQISLLPEGAFIFSQSSTSAIQDELTRLMDAPDRGVHVFGAGGYGNIGTGTQLLDVPETSGDAFLRSLGVSFRANDTLTGGILFTLGRNRTEWGGDRGKFDTNALMGAVFVRWGGAQGLYIDAEGRAAKLDFAVDRTFALGPTFRTEESDPEGWAYGGRLGAGWWFGNDAFRTGPMGSLNWQRVDIDAFAEHGGDATAMTFGEQKRESLVGQIGWQVEGRGSFKPYAAVSYGHEFDADRAVVTAGLVSLNGTFSMPGYKPAESWVEGSVGVSKDFGEHFGAHLGYTGRFADDDRRAHLITLGLHSSF